MQKIFVLVLGVMLSGLCQAADFSVIRQYAYPLIIMNSNNSQRIATPVGSGTMIMIGDGYALTAGHVVPTSSNSTMVAIAGDKIVKAIPIKIDRVQDVALAVGAGGRATPRGGCRGLGRGRACSVFGLRGA